jgi:hypothetical protein
MLSCILHCVPKQLVPPRFTKHSNRYAFLNDDEDCLWLLAPQSPGVVSDKTDLFVAVWNEMSTTTTSTDVDAVSWSEFSVDGGATFFPRRPLAPPSETESDTDEESETAAFVELKIPAPEMKESDSNEEGDTTTSVELKVLAPETGDSKSEEESMATICMELKIPAPETGDSETEEESMESSSELKPRRSIRFADEVEGQQLETIRAVPWSEHDDEKWIPRQVRCRVEL